MAKKTTTYRFADDTLKKLEKIVAFHNKLIDNAKSPVNANVNKTSVIAYLIDKEYSFLVDNDYKL